ncbi:hypothetical protein RJ641_014972 [Dillenia turbinata]|uniref:Uncharacterized protein n=1 Tax=Dillenia turbinata TaxID=194707 RepID=A0AAN8UV83_9MAGN
MVKPSPEPFSSYKARRDNAVLADGPKSKCNGIVVWESSSTCGNSMQPTFQFSVGLQEATDYKRFYGKVSVSKRIQWFPPSSFMLKGSDFEAEEDDLILKLAPKIDKLQNELQKWKDWTSQYIRQATSTIKESNQMKLQLQEAERKEIKITETSAKRLSEMVSAVEYANSRLKKARETLRKLEAKNTNLKEKMARLQAEISDAKIVEWEEKEHTAIS